MTKRDLIPIWKSFEELSKITGKVTFAYGISKNIALIKDEIIAINKTETFMNDYEVARQEINKRYCQKDESGNPIVLDVGGVKKYSGCEEGSEWRKELDAATKVYNDMNAEYESLLDQAIPDPEFTKINIKDFPDSVNAMHLLALKPIIEE